MTKHARISFAPAPYTRRFHLIRDTDVSGISGTGCVAAGVQWPDGTVAMRWLTYTASTSVYASLDDVEIIHGHQGATRITFDDDNAGTFVFVRLPDHSDGYSEHVADGVVWDDGSVSIRWRGKHASVVYWDSLDSALAVHNHDDRTRFDFSRVA